MPETQSNARLAQLLKEQEEAARKALEAVKKPETPTLSTLESYDQIQAKQRDAREKFDQYAEEQRALGATEEQINEAREKQLNPALEKMDSDWRSATEAAATEWADSVDPFDLPALPDKFGLGEAKIFVEKLLQRLARDLGVTEDNSVKINVTAPNGLKGTLNISIDSDGNVRGVAGYEGGGAGKIEGFGLINFVSTGFSLATNESVRSRDEPVRLERPSKIQTPVAVEPAVTEVAPEVSENVAAWNQIKTEFASLSEDDVKAGRGQFFAYNPDLKEEANVHDVEKKITVGPKFFEKTEAQRLEIIGHEFSHRLSDSMLKDLSAFDLADEGAFGPKNPETGKLSEGINGQDTPAENIAEAASLIITGSQKDINFLKERYPVALQKITERMIQDGYPVSDVAIAALPPTPESAPVTPTPVTPTPVTPEVPKAVEPPALAASGLTVTQETGTWNPITKQVQPLAPKNGGRNFRKIQDQNGNVFIDDGKSITVYTPQGASIELGRDTNNQPYVSVEGSRQQLGEFGGFEQGGQFFLNVRQAATKLKEKLGASAPQLVDNIVGVQPVGAPAPATEAVAITEEQANNAIKAAQEERARKPAKNIGKSDWGVQSVSPKDSIGKTAREALIFSSRLNLSKIAGSNPEEIMMQDVAAILAELDMPILDLEPIVSLSSLGKKGRPRRFPRGENSVVGLPSTIPMPVKTIVHELGHTLTADQIKRYLPRKKTGSGKAYLDALNKAIADPKTPEAVNRLFSLYVSTIDQLGITEQYFGKKGVAGTPKADTSKAMAKRLQAKGLLRKDLKGSDLYGLANVEEFVSQTFSEPSFRNILKGLKDPTNPKRTLWQAFVDAIQAILQLPKGSMAAAVIQASVDVGMTVPPARVRGRGVSPAPEAIESRRETESTLKITADDARELQYKIGTLLENADLQSDYGISREQAKQIYNSIPTEGGNWDVPAWANQAIKGELEDQSKVLSDMADDARSENRIGEALRMNKQAKRFKQLSESLQQGEADIDMAPEPEASPFYSQLQRVVDEKMPNVSSPQQIKAIIDPSRGSGVKPEEIKWSGINEAIDRIALENNGRVPKDKLVEYLQADGSVQFEENKFVERQKARASVYTVSVADFRVIYYKNGERIEERFDNDTDARLRADELNRTPARVAAHSSWQLNGGKNYREVVIALSPESQRDAIRSQIFALQQQENNIIINAQVDAGREVNEEESKQIENLRKEIREKENLLSLIPADFRSSHFAEIENYLAHYRANDRPDSRGLEGVFLEELQSDRHQQGRKFGYDGNVNFVRIIDSLGISELQDIILEVEPNRSAEVDRMLQREMRDVVKGYMAPENQNTQRYDVVQFMLVKAAKAEDMMPVADAPFRQSREWGLQLFKRALVDAVARGKSWIGWTTGDTQVERYKEGMQREVDLLKINKLSNGQYNFTAAKGPLNLIEEFNVSAQRIRNLLGKAAEDLILQADQKPNETIVVRSSDMRVGGEGMREFYDNILPNEIKKYVKKWGATIEKGELTVSDKGRQFAGSMFFWPPEGATFRIWQNQDGTLVIEEFIDGAYTEPIGAIPQEIRDKFEELSSKATIDQPAKFWRVDITPEMEASVEEAGQPLYAAEPEEFEIVPERVEDQIEGTPEAATISVMGQAFQMANEQSATLGTAEGTLPLETITSAWMNSGRDVETLENAIIRYTNLDPEVAATLAEAISQQVEIQRGIMEISDAASRRKAEKEDEPETKPYSFAERIKGELPPILRKKVNLAYEVLRNEVSVQEANQAMSGLTVDEAIEATTNMSNGVSMPVRSMMGQIVLRKIMAQRKATKGKKGKQADYEAIVEAHVDFFNWFSEYSKELGQGVQAIARFSDLGADGILLKVRKDIDKAISKHIKNRKGQIDQIKRDVEDADNAAFNAAIKANKGNIDNTAKKAGEQEAKKMTIEEQAQKLAIRAAKKVTGEEIRRRQPDPLSELVNGHLRRYNANFVTEAAAMGVSPVTAQAIEDSAKKLRDSRVATKNERERFKEMQDERMKVKKELARENKYIYGPRPTIWENYQDMFSERLARRLMRDPKKKVPPSLLLFTDRLTENLLGFVPEAQRQTTTQRSFQAMIEDALNNKEKYQEAFNRALEDISFKVMELETKAAFGEKVSSAAYKKAVAAQEFRERLEPIIQQFPVSDKLIMRFVNQKMKAMGESLVGRYNDWYRSSIKTRINIEKALAEKLMEDMNVSNADAINLSRAVIKDFRAKAEERREKALARFKKPKEKTKRLA